MDTTKFTMGIVGLVVIILMVTGAVLPAVEDAQSKQVTEVNNTSERYMAASNLTFTLTFDSETSTPIINGEPFVKDPAYNLYVVTDKFMVKSQRGSSAYGSWAVRSVELLAGDVYSKDNVTVTSDNGAVTIKDSEENVILSTTIQFAFIPSDTGTYGSFEPNTSASRILHADPAATIYYLNVGSTFYLAKTNPTAKNPLSADIMFNYDGTTMETTGTVTANGTHITEDDNDYYNITSKASLGGASAIVLAPIAYHVVTDDDSMMRSLIGIIPLLLIIVAVLYAVRLMGASRN